MTNLFTEEDFKNCTFKWEDLDGKTLEIRVHKCLDSGMIVCAIDQSGRVYVMHQEIIEEKL